MGFCVGSAMCCAGALCCRCLCAPAKAAGVAAKNYSKLGYVVFQLSWIIMVIILSYLFEWIHGWGGWIGIQCPNGGDSGEASCVGASSLIRLSFALACFHTVMLIVVCLRNTCAEQFHDGCWGLKLLMVAAIWIPSFWIVNDPFFDGYLAFARYVSVLFLMYQALLILVVAYTLNSTLVENVSRDEGGIGSCSGIILLTLFLVLTGGNVTWIVFQFIEFGNEGCGGNITFMIITCILSLFMYVIVVFRTREDASLLTSAIVVAYNLYLQWSAMSSNPDQTCNPYTQSAGNTTG